MGRLVLVCAAAAVLASMVPCPAGADDWPQWLGPRRDGVWREAGVRTTWPEGGPKVRWRAPVGGGYAGPAVAGGRVYVMDRQLAEGGPRPRNAFDRSAAVPGTERILCFDAGTGKEIWAHAYDCPYNLSYGSGPRVTPAIDGDRVYALGAEGHLTCLDAATGKVHWQKKLSGPDAPTPIWGFAGHPLVDGDRVYVTSSGKAITALNKVTGEVLWRAVDHARDGGPGYAAPMLFEAGGRRQLISFIPEALVSLDAETGRELWRQEIRPAIKNGVSIVAPVRKDDLLLATSIFSGVIAMRLHADEPRATLLYRRGSGNERRTQSIQSLMSNLVLLGEHAYGVCAFGELRCIEARTGERVWETLAATSSTGEPIMWTSAFVVPVMPGGAEAKAGEPQVVYIANDQGELILARLSPKGYEELGRTKLLEPTNRDARRPVLWCHPAFANRSVYWRNDKELICVDVGE